MGWLSAIDGKVGKLDELYFSIDNFRNRRSPPLFHRGWGRAAALDAAHTQWHDTCPPVAPAVTWDREWTEDKSGLECRSGTFDTPALRAHLPPESAVAAFTHVSPMFGVNPPTVLVMPTSREAGVHGRWPLACALARRGIASVLLESPFMGRRKPADQWGATLSHFSDFVVLAGACIEEGRAMLAWLTQQGVHRIAVAGISKGGYLAAATGLRSPQAPRIVAFLPPVSGVPVLIDGLMGRLCAWDALQATSGSSRPVRQQMIEVFEATSLQRLPVRPRSGSLKLVAARNDRYVPVRHYEQLARHWSGHANVSWLPGGHVSTIAERHHICDAIVASLSVELPSSTGEVPA